jgi:hypothetical protein
MRVCKLHLSKSPNAVLQRGKAKKRKGGDGFSHDAVIDQGVISGARQPK